MRKTLDEEKGTVVTGLLLLRYAGAALLLGLVFSTALFLFEGRDEKVKSNILAELAGNRMQPSLIKYGLSKAPEEKLVVWNEDETRVASLQVPLPTDDVVFYWIMPTPTFDPESPRDNMEEPHQGEDG